MARLQVSGIAELNKLLSDLADDIQGEGIDKALIAGGELLAEFFVGATVAEGLVDTGQLRDSMAATKPEGSPKYVDVYPQGTRSDGKRNAEVGAYMEYGVTRIPPLKDVPATHWMSNAVDDTKEDVLDAMEASINETIDKHFGGND